MDHYQTVMQAILEVSEEAGIQVTHRPVSRMQRASEYVALQDTSEFELSKVHRVGEAADGKFKLRGAVYG